MLCYLLVLAVLVWEWARGSERLRDDSVARSSRASFPLARVTLLVISLVGLFALQIAIVALLAQDDAVTHASAAFPLGIVDDRIGALSVHRAPATAAMLAVVLLETVALLMLGRELTAPGGRGMLKVVGAGAAVMYALALVAPALSSADMYLYSGYALLGAKAYDPPALPFAGQYQPIDVWWHIPLAPSPYGPLWLAYNWLLVSWAPTLLAKLEILRAAGIVWLLIILRCAWRRGVRPEVLALLALNPAIAFQFIANGHNDIVGVGLAVLALAAARLGPKFQVPLVVAAGLVKLPFVALAAVTLAGSRRTRIAAGAACFALTAVASLIVGGRSYATGLLHYGHIHSEMLSPPHAVLLGCAAVALAAALLFNRWSVVAPLSFPSLAVAIFPWYVIWGLPYAMVARSLVFFLIALPLACFLFDPAFDTLWLLFAAILVFSALAGGELISRRKRLRSSVPSGVPSQA